MAEPVSIPSVVYEGLEAVRRSGVVNMFDRKGVQYYANEGGYYAAVVWLEDNPREYAQGIFHGFEPEPVA